jgi:hypothetical protein
MSLKENNLNNKTRIYLDTFLFLLEFPWTMCSWSLSCTAHVYIILLIGSLLIFFRLSSTKVSAAQPVNPLGARTCFLISLSLFKSSRFTSCICHEWHEINIFDYLYENKEFFRFTRINGQWTTEIWLKQVKKLVLYLNVEIFRLRQCCRNCNWQQKI